MQQDDKELPESCRGALEHRPNFCPWRSHQIKSGRHKLSRTLRSHLLEAALALPRRSFASFLPALVVS